MASSAPNPPGSRRIAFLIALALAPAACSRGGFYLEGVVTAPPRQQRLAERDNSVLFVVAVNSRGVPVAVKRFVNPRLPLDYELLDADLVLPGPAWAGDLSVQVHVNRHGTLGLTERGDLRGVLRGHTRAGESHANVVIDEEL